MCCQPFLSYPVSYDKYHMATLGVIYLYPWKFSSPYFVILHKKYYVAPVYVAM